MSFVFKGVWLTEVFTGNVYRIIGNQHLAHLDPFPFFDYFKMKLPLGFPDHPHRGIETVTYMKRGKFYHQDFKGHRGEVGPGDVQWMTAGKGIVHCEIPASAEEESTGFQLWLNLKAKDKMQEPKYQQINKEHIPVFEKDGMKVKIVCGKWQGHQGPIKYQTPAYFMDIEALKDGQFQIPINKTWNSIAFVHEGEVIYNCGDAKHEVKTLEACVLEKSEDKELVHNFNVKKGGQFVLVAGQPLNQPFVRKGPFVMNTQQEVNQAYSDHKYYKNGFEDRKNWESKVKLLMKGKKYEDLF